MLPYERLLTKHQSSSNPEVDDTEYYDQNVGYSPDSTALGGFEPMEDRDVIMVCSIRH
jgi:hypothetical protein